MNYITKVRVEGLYDLQLFKVLWVRNIGIQSFYLNTYRGNEELCDYINSTLNI